MARPIPTRRWVRRGFTLVEVLLVVLILGILAAVVVARMTDASTEARKSGTAGQLQVIRRQLELYKAHYSELPDLTRSWDPMMNAGTTGEPPVATGPYLVVLPFNQINGKNNVTDGDGSSAAGSPCGFIFDYTGGTGRLLATDKDGVTPLGY